MSGSNHVSDLLKNEVTKKVLNTINQITPNGKKDEKTLFGVKLNSDDLEKVTHAIAGAASTIGPILAKSREKTVGVAQNAAQNAPSLDKFEEQFSAAIEAIDKRQADARDRVKAKAGSAKEVTSNAASETQKRVKAKAESAKDATSHAASDAQKRVKSKADSAVEASSHAASEARERVKSSAETAKETTAHVAAETADASKNLVGFLFWLGAAGATVYYLILNPERREQVMSAAKSTANVAWGIVSEVRGEDGNFTA